MSAETSFDDTNNKEALNVNNVLSVNVEKKWDINYIQILTAQVQQKALRKILEEAFITRNCTQT